MTPEELDTKVSGLSYEDARSRLVETVTRLEQGNLPLEEALAMWELGEALARRCESWLDGARNRLRAAQLHASQQDETGTQETTDPRENTNSRENTDSVASAEHEPGTASTPSAAARGAVSPQGRTGTQGASRNAGSGVSTSQSEAP